MYQRAPLHFISPGLLETCVGESRVGGTVCGSLPAGTHPVRGSDHGAPLGARETLGSCCCTRYGGAWRPPRPVPSDALHTPADCAGDYWRDLGGLLAERLGLRGGCAGTPTTLPKVRRGRGRSKASTPWRAPEGDQTLQPGHPDQIWTRQLTHFGGPSGALLPHPQGRTGWQWAGEGRNVALSRPPRHAVLKGPSREPTWISGSAAAEEDRRPHRTAAARRRPVCARQNLGGVSPRLRWSPCVWA